MNIYPRKKNLLFAIGINQYQEQSRIRIYNAKADVKRFINVMRDRYGFETYGVPIFDEQASRELILDELENLGPESLDCQNLIIYFAGHGEMDSLSEIGYWVPTDANLRASSYIPNSSVIDAIKRIKAEHILLISDSCYSGTFIKHHGIKGMVPASNEEVESNSRWVFSSGDMKRVSDGPKGKGSPFAQALNSYMETNKTSKIHAKELFAEVSRATREKLDQLPIAAEIYGVDSLGGEMTFEINILPSDEKKYPTKKIKFPFSDIQLPKNYISRYITFNDEQYEDTFSFFSPEIGRVYLKEVIHTQRHLVLLGAAGSGKSIELAHLAFSLQDDKEALTPIFHKLNDYDGLGLSGYLPTGWNDTDPARLIIFLDGLDEIQPQLMAIATDEIGKFAKENPSIRMVISCRTNFYEDQHQNSQGTIDGFKVYHIGHISSAKIKEFLEENFDFDAVDFLEKIYLAKFSDLVHKPFFLNIFIEHYLMHQNFSSGRASIMESSLLSYYKSIRAHEDSNLIVMEDETMLNHLEKIAFIMELTGINFLSDEDLQYIFPQQADYLQCKFLPAFVYHPNTDQWMFEHNNIQEYLAARILSRQKIDILTAVLFVKTPQGKFIKPNWVNTLSFLMSISTGPEVEKLLGIILDLDHETIVKFEPDRIQPAQRTKIFKHIFNFYSDKGVWVSSNKFSTLDLVRFGATAESLMFLLEKLQSQASTNMDKRNAILQLQYFDFRPFGPESLKTENVLLDLVFDETFIPADLQMIISTLVHLNMSDQDKIQRIIDKYSLNVNQYIRAALYELISSLKHPEKYLKVLLDGFAITEIEHNTGIREGFSLGDEDYHLHEALKKIKSPTGLHQLLTTLTTSATKRLAMIHHHRESLEAIIENTVKAFKQEDVIFQVVFDLFILAASEYEEQTMTLLTTFFDQTNTRGRALIAVATKKCVNFYDFHNIVLPIVNQSAIRDLVEYYKTNEIQTEVLEMLHGTLWSMKSVNESLDTFLREQCLVTLGVTLIEPQTPPLTNIWMKRRIENLEILFQPIKIIALIKNFFLAAEKDELFSSDITELNKVSHKDPSRYFPQIVFQILRHLSHGDKKVTLILITDWIKENLSFRDFQINEIYNSLKNNTDFEINRAKIDFIQIWSATYGNNLEIVWYFLHRFKLHLPEEKILDLTGYFNFNGDVKIEDTGSIELLEKHINITALHQRVTQNVANIHFKKLPWLSNASYALRRGISSTFPDIIDFLELSQQDEYRFETLLKYWFKMTLDIPRLREFIEKAKSTSLRWKAIQILSAELTEHTFLKKILDQELANEDSSIEVRLLAANELINIEQLNGFEFIYTLINSD